MRFKILYIFLLYIFFFNPLFANTKFFQEGLNLYNKKKFEKAKFKFEQDIVLNPKSEISYLYLAKIFKIEENNQELGKYLETALLLESSNEEAMYMLIEIELENDESRTITLSQNEII